MTGMELSASKGGVLSRLNSRMPSFSLAASPHRRAAQEVCGRDPCFPVKLSWGGVFMKRTMNLAEG